MSLPTVSDKKQNEISNLIICADFGKHLPNVGPCSPSTGELIKYGELDVLKKAFEKDGHRIAAFMIEPIQGLAGSVRPRPPFPQTTQSTTNQAYRTRIPHEGYLASIQNLCHEHNILFICDEVQTGYGRTGTDLAYQHEPDVQPDLVTLGKAVTGGMYPMSIVMGKAHVMDVLTKAEVAGTFAASPIACAAALAALDVLEDESISLQAQQKGTLFTQAIDNLNLPYITEHRGRGRGLFQTLEIDETQNAKVTARRIAALCALRGVLVGNGANRLRFSPPLTISETDLLKAAKVLKSAFEDVVHLDEFPGSAFLN